MKLESVVAWGGSTTGLLALAAGVAISVLLGFGYRATREWQRSSQLLIKLDTKEVADLLVTAVSRDMTAVQSRVLANRDWAESAVSLSDISAQVAVAFTRYPYPESFFSWNGDDSGVMFFNRADRYPEWLPPAQLTGHFPVILTSSPPGAASLRRRIDAYGAARYRYVAFETELSGRPYEVVARLMYAEPMQEAPHSVIGFTVNLDWVRHSYFGDLLSQVAPLPTRGDSLEIGVLDDKGQLLWGTDSDSPDFTKEFPLLFLNPSLGKVALEPGSGVRTWKIRVGQAHNSPLIAASQGADHALLVAAAAAVMLCLGLILAFRSVQRAAVLASMRTDFVSSVTHDLKMPLANIRVLADTLAIRPLGPERIQDYARLLRQESKRLSRLIDNLLAYARVTSVADVYTFQPLELGLLVNGVIQSFQHQLTARRFRVDIDIPGDLPVILADRDAFVLAFDNLVDNAIRYSVDGGSLAIVARRHAREVSVEVRDSGMGIPADELGVVRRQFVRGRFAKPGGSGLGLSIVSRIVTAHGGSFALESERGVGTVARLNFQVVED